MATDRTYVINIDPRILELLGPSLYTNIYYVLAELVANAYDADASNVYIIEKDDAVIVEDDGTGMSYQSGDIEKYLNVAIETRTEDSNAHTASGKRKRMGRKGVGKLAALSVSENVLVMTKKDGEQSGFILSRRVGADHRLQPLDDSQIKFEQVQEVSHGTSVVMTNPQYGLHKTAAAIKNNLLKIFPLINSGFKVHIINNIDHITIDNFDKEIIENLGALIILGEEFHHLANHFDPGIANDPTAKNALLDLDSAKEILIKMKNKNGEEKEYKLVIKGWIGAYQSTRGRKSDPNDFPDNFISLLSNQKLGEYNILPIVGKNRLYEVYVVGQLHVDLFEETELPDMALSNRQGYKTDDKRYVKVIEYVRDELLPRIIEKRVGYKTKKDQEIQKSKQAQQRKDEEELRTKVEEYKNELSDKAAQKIGSQLGEQTPSDIKEIIRKEVNDLLPIVGLKKKVDSQKRRILISHASVDKDLADIVYKMLLFNNITPEEIIYTSSEDADSRIPNDQSTFDYLREFFVESYSDEKIFVVYVTSEAMSQRWFPVTEVGAGWITRSKHDVFNIKGYTPLRPLDTDLIWQTSVRKSSDEITATPIEFDRFIVKVTSVCNFLGRTPKSKVENEQELVRHLTKE